MSLNETLINAINNVVSTYMDLLVEKYDLDKNELQKLWLTTGEGKQGSKQENKEHKKENKQEEKLGNYPEISEEKLIKSTNTELKAMCKSRGLKCAGKKAELVARLLGLSDETKTTKKSNEKKSAKPAAVNKVLQKVANTENIAIRKNSHQNYEHALTGLIFDRETKEVCGKQNEDGSVAELTSEDIDVCKQYKFNYIVPSNLDRQNNLTDVKIKELENEDEEEEEIDEPEDEEDIEMVLDNDVEDEDEEVLEEVLEEVEEDYEEEED